MSVPSMGRRGPGLTRAQGPSGQIVTLDRCQCSCHPPTVDRPQAVEARLCQPCADERFQAWQSLVDVLMRDE
jgi:hypothetical protein